MSIVYANEPIILAPGESRLCGFIFTTLLAANETLSSPTVDGDGLTAGTPTVNAGTFLDDDGTTIAIGKAVQVRLSGGTAGTNYVVKCTVNTSASNTLVRYFPVKCRGE